MTEPAFIFVYGTLRRDSGHAMSHWLARCTCWYGQGRITGRLYRVSYYPALQAGDGQVYGDLYRLENPESVFSVLDAFEGIRGWAEDEYERCLSAVLLENGESVMAWVYWYRLSVAALEQVYGGDWLQQK